MKTKYLLTFTLLFYCLSVFAKNNIAFIENKGQVIDQNNHVNNSVKYIAYHKGIKLELKNNSFSYEILHSEKLKKQSFSHLSKNLLKHLEYRYGNIDDSIIHHSHRIDVELLNANSNPLLKAEGQSEEYLNYYTTGTPEEGVTYVHQYQKVTYKDIYPNIDLEFVLDGKSDNGFKYNFIVHPRGKVSDIQLQYKGGNSTELTANGSLNIATAYGNVEENIPSSYIAETGKEITVNYQQNHEGVFGFSAGNYNTQQTLVIDPWCTYFGWSGSQQGLTGSGSIITDASRNIYTDGSVDIMTNIATTGSYQNVYGGGVRDVFMRKFNPNGTPIWCTYYGGSDEDRGGRMSIDELANLYITGITFSPNNIATPGSFSSAYTPVTFSFISKFNSNGIRQWGSYYPAFISSIKLDNTDNIVVVGSVGIDTGIATAGAHQTILGGNQDALLTKFTSNGTRIWGTYYGGYEIDRGDDIIVDISNNIYISGITQSVNNISTIGSFQQNFGGLSDNFLAKFSSSGVRQWGTYYGGTDEEAHLTSISNDYIGNFYFIGEAQSMGIFATTGAFQPSGGSLGGGGDYCLAKFSTVGQRLWSTYFDGNDQDWILDLKIDSQGNPVFSGSTFSTNIIASTGCLQPLYNGNQDAFIEKFDPSGSRIWGTYFGGTEGENGAAIAIDNQDNIIISGNTFSKGIATTGAYQTALIDTLYGDIFLASLDSNGTFTTGFGEVAPKTSLIQVYPNPAKEQITVSIKDYTNQAATLSIQDVGGKLLQTQAVHSSTNTLHLKDLPAGVYLLQYDDGEVCETLKIVKE